MKKNLLKSMLVALMVMVGGSAWAQTTYFSQDYEGDGATADWTTATSGRFTPAILEESGNHFLSVDQSTRNNNGTTITSTATQGKVDANTPFTMTFDMRLSSSSNQNATQFTIYDAANSGTLFSLKETGTWATTWILNGVTSNTVTLPNSNKASGSNTIADVTWCSYKISYTESGITYLTIINKETEDVIFERAIVGGGNSTGGLGKMTFVTSRYLANFAIDNVVVREIQDGDIPVATPTTYTIKFVDENSNTIKEDAVINTVVGLEITAAADYLASIYANDKKYIYKSGNNAITTVEAGESNVITLVFREAAIWNYTVNATGEESAIIKEIAKGTAFEADAVTVPYPMYVNVEGTLWTKAATNKEYRTTVTLTQDNTVANLAYTATDIANVIYLSEGENIEGTTIFNGSNADIRSSNAAAGWSTKKINLTTLPVGKYNINGVIIANSGTPVISFAIGNREVLAITATNSNWTNGNAEFVNAKEKPITFVGGNSKSGLDFVYIQKLADPTEEELDAAKKADAAAAYGKIWEDGETTTDDNNNTIAEVDAAYFNEYAKANDTIRATVVVAAPARTAGPARIIATGKLFVYAGMSLIYEAANIPVGESTLDIALDNEDLAAIAEAGSLKFVYNNLTLKKVELVEGAVDPAAIAAAKEALQTAIAIASNINPEGLAEAIAAAQAVLTNEDATLQQIIQATQALETAIKSYFEAVLPRLGAIVGGLNDSTLNAAYADAQAALAKEDVTPQELAAAMQKIIVVAQAVAPEHLNNLKGYAVKYGAEDAVALVDSALVAINEGNVAKIIATMAAVKEAATPLAKQVLGGIIEYVKAFGLTEQAAQAQAALESDNYVTMITVAKALFNHLIAAAKDYLPKLAIIAEGLNDSTLNVAYAEADTLLAKESITPEELGAAMQKIIVAAKAVAPAHLQNLRAYALKYGQEGTAALVDSALVAINEGNVSKIIATMTAVREAATPLATNILTQLVGYAQNYDGFEEDVTEAQAVLRGGNYITMITTAKALYAKLIAAAKAYVTKVKAIPTEGKEGVEDLNTAINAAELALAAEDSDFSAINTAITNLIAAVKAFTKVNEIAANEALVAGASLENPVAAPFVVNGTFDENTNGWTSTGEFQNRGTATNQAGAFTGKFWENWNPDPKVNKMYQIAECIPNGIYKLNIAAFVNTLATPNESQYVYANNDKEFLTTGEPTMYEVYTKVENNTMEFGLEQTTATANWMGIDNISLTYYGTECTIEQVKAAAFYAEIDAALAAKQSVKTKNALETAYEAYKAEANDEKLNTLKEALANAKASINSYKILETGIIPDNSLEGWTCTNTNTFHINTWSGEGNSDGSNMTTPFIENWVYRDNVLGTGEIYYTLPGLDPGIYSFTALIRAYSESGNAPTGASLFAQDREKEFATGKSFEYNNMKGIYDNYAMSAEVGEDGVFRFGIKISAEANFNWMAFKNCRVAYVGAAIDEAAVNGLAATMPEGKMNAEIKTAADNAIATLRQEINLDNYEAAQKAIAAAKASIEAYAKMKSVLDFIAEEVAKTNMYTAAAKATFDESIATAQKGYDEGTMSDADAAAFNYGSRLEGLLPTLLLSAYTSDVEGTPYINTWSVEGDNDGSEFKVPFYEYWTGDGNSLAANTITATLTGLEAGNYEVKAWVRVRMKNGAEAPAGITMSVNDETAVDVCAGDQIGTSPLYAKEFTAVGDVFAGDNLKFKFNIAADNTISWLSFKNVKYTRLSETVGITKVKSENKLDGTVYNLNGQKVEKAQRGLYIVNGKKVVVK